jgi:hypothetical protein
MESTEELRQTYIAQCARVMAGAEECLGYAQDAAGNRAQAEVRPQHEISIGHFNKLADEAEEKLATSYPLFSDLCDSTRETARYLLASYGDHFRAEFQFPSDIPEEVLGEVATVKCILSSTYGPTPDEFLGGLEQTNTLIGAGVDGIIYGIDLTLKPEGTSSDENAPQGAKDWL